MLGTAFLTCGGLTSVWRLIHTDSISGRSINDELCVTCAATHLGFVVLIFGHRGTWFYSLPMLILGLGTLAARSHWHRSILYVLVILLLISDRSKALDIIQRWKSEVPAPATLNLWANPEEQAEWTRALELTRGRQPVLLAMSEGGFASPGICPTNWRLFRPRECSAYRSERKTAQLAAAHMIISAQPSNWPGFMFWPEMKAVFDDCELLFKGHYVRVYRRLAPSDAHVD